MTDQQIEAEALAFAARCRPFAPPTESPLRPATSRLVWALRDRRSLRDYRPWSFNRREVRELHTLIERLLDEVLARQAEAE